MMARQITRELADRIVKKLNGIVDRSTRNHDLVNVFHDDMLIASFGLRRGSSRDIGHDHIPNALHVGPRFAKEMGQCTKSREEWVNELISKGLIAAPEERGG